MASSLLASTPFFSNTKCQVAALVSLRGRKNVTIQGPITFVASFKMSSSAANRRSGNYLPCLWNDDYLQLLRSEYKGDDHVRHIEELEGKVRMMLNNAEELLDQLELIDNLQRLGASQGKWIPFFSSFRDETRNFRLPLKDDIKAMPSLYEASYYCFEGESIMEAAWNFTSEHLRYDNGDVDPNLAIQVRHALELPIHWRMPRWWKNTGLGEKLSFARNRKILTKAIALITVIDDTYDVYGTLDELGLFIDAVERLVVNEMAYDILKEHGYNVVLNLKKADKLKRGDVAKSIQCYMHENDVSEEASREHIRNLMREAWKKVNVHRAAVYPLSQNVTGIILNLVRTAHCIYQHGDGHGFQNHKTKDHAMSLLFDPIPL
ncbi:Terpene synthase [Theobroma cacao]|nr:Terpene synthase [Theobroma cacao]